MELIELEKMLMDPEGVKKLVDRANEIKQKPVSEPIIKPSVAELMPYVKRPTPEEIKAISDDFLVGTPLLPDVGLFLPEFKGKEPKEVLLGLTEEYKKNPSESARLLVGNAINRLTLAPLDQNAQSLVDGAIEALHSPRVASKKAGGREPAPGEGIWSVVYRDHHFAGDSAFLDLGPGPRYKAYYQSFLQSKNLNNAISSLSVFAGKAEVAGLVILFENDSFRGRFATFATTPGTVTRFSDVGPFINDRASSILVVRRSKNEITIPLVTFYPALKDDIKKFVKKVPSISLRGDPIITWDIPPEQTEYKGLMFIYILIPITAHISYWPDYKAEMRLWILPWVSEEGALNTDIFDYGAWVESGLLHNKIRDKLNKGIRDNIGTIQSNINDAADMINVFKPFAGSYLLPGKASEGHTTDDVTIVLVKK